MAGNGTMSGEKFDGMANPFGGYFLGQRIVIAADGAAGEVEGTVGAVLLRVDYDHGGQQLLSLHREYACDWFHRPAELAELSDEELMAEIAKRGLGDSCGRCDCEGCERCTNEDVTCGCGE